MAVAGTTRRLGMLTPSSNTVLEPVCAAMLAPLPAVSVHFSRFRVTEISLSEAGLRQFDHTPMLQAASLLADARVDSICWNGTSAAWMGLRQDRDLCAAITAHTGIPATSSMLGLFDLVRGAGLTRVGLVTPYTDDVQAAILATFAREGLDCIAERHAGLSENFAFSRVGPEAIAHMARDVAQARPNAIVILCTNLAGAPHVAALEAETGCPVLDSVAMAVWAALRQAGVAIPAALPGFSRLMRP